MTIKEAINFVDIARMNYICDPQECGLEKGEDPCTAFHCDEMHDALVMAIEALHIADRLEHCYFTDHQDDYYNYDDSEYSAGYQMGYIDGYKQALSDVRGDNNGKE